MHISPTVLALSFPALCQLHKNRTIMIGTQEIILIVLVVLLLFGGKKIPELMKGLGKGVKSFKDGVNGIPDSEDTDGNKETKEAVKKD